jgi:hypothetical protein
VAAKKCESERNDKKCVNERVVRHRIIVVQVTKEIQQPNEMIKVK